MVHGLTERFAKSNLKLISQMRDAARSAKQNIREGYSRGTLSEFIRSIRISQGSLEELQGEMEDCLQDKLISSPEFEKFAKLYRSAHFLSMRYIKSMNKADNKGKWKIPGEQRRHS